MGIIRDTWRAVLVLAVGTMLLEAAGLRRHPPAVATTAPVYHAAPPMVAPVVIHQQAPPPQPDRPLRRVAAAVMEVGDSMIGVFR